MFSLLVVARWVHFASLSVVVGGSVFWLYERPAWAAGRLPETLASTHRLVRVCALLAAASGLAWLAATIATVTGGIASLADRDMLHVFFFETPFGPVWMIRLVLLGALVLGAVIAATPMRCFVASGILGAMLLASQAWLGHAVEGGTDARGIAMLAAYAAHVLGAAAWVGGLPPLALALAESRQTIADSFDLLARYSSMAIVVVVLIVGSGITNTLFHVSDFGQLLASTYGAVLAMKIALVVAMLLLASINRFVLMPRLRDHGRGAAQILSSVVCEALLAILVFAAAAVLGITPPPH